MAPTYFLGISDTQFDSGIALTDGKSVLYAANEERHSRRKNEGGFPFLCLQALNRLAPLPPGAALDVCVASVVNPPLLLRMFPFLQKILFGSIRSSRPSAVFQAIIDWIVFRTPLVSSTPQSLLGRLTQKCLERSYKRRLARRWPVRSLRFIDHHQAHAASAFALSGFGTALVVTCDGMGDGVSLTVNRGDPEGLRRLWSLPASVSYGTFYENVTEALGFTPNRDEGKVTGLAAYGKAGRVAEPFPFKAHPDGRVTFHGRYGRGGVRWVRQRLLAKHSREDVAAWAQDNLEKHLVALVERWASRTGLRRLALAGGVFANVKLNQRLHEEVPLDGIFVCPNMGDGGLSLGAVASGGGLRQGAVPGVFWGDGFSDRELDAALRRFPVKAERCDDPDARAARLLSEGALVARFQGRMEWGPRALGNRSVLAQPDDARVAARLNACLRRSDFMPFAPAVLEECASDYLAGLEGARHAAEFMTLCLRGTDRMLRENPAAAHVDGTVRPQLVRAESNPSLHRLLTEYRELTGRGVLLNTSFNIHEEPIVRTPEEALDTFLRSGLDCLILGNHVVEALSRSGRGAADAGTALPLEKA